MHLPPLFYWNLLLHAASASTSAADGEVTRSPANKKLMSYRTQDGNRKSFITRSLDLTHEYPHQICRRSMDVNVDQDKEEEDFLSSYPFSFSNVLSPYTGLGQLIVNPSPYVIDHSASPGPEPVGLENDQINRPNIPSLMLPTLSVNSIVNVGLTPSKPSTKPITSAYYPDWNLHVLKPQQIQYTKYDIIFFAFAIPNQDFGIEFTQSDSINTLQDLVRCAHANGTKVVLSIGGWGGSKFFSAAVKSETTRQIFSNNILQLVLSHDLDGIDIDWEYPGQAQIQDNIVSDKDSTALLSFLKLLRLKLGPQKIISAAVTDFTFLNSKGDRMTDVSEFGKVLDYILIMNYDVWGASSNPGSNAPFSNGCEDSSQPDANMVSSIKTWTSAGFPRQKILMGLPAYGYINHASTTTLVHKKRSQIDENFRSVDGSLFEAKRPIEKLQAPCPNFNGTCITPLSPNITTSAGPNQTTFLKTDQALAMSSNQVNSSRPNVTLSSATGPFPLLGFNKSSTALRLNSNANPGVGDGNLDSYSGNQIQFSDLFKWGILERNLSDVEGRFTGINGYQLAWDSCSSTPYAICQSRNIVITYDDAISTGIKASYALAAGIGGVGFWEITGDYQSILIDSARKNLGIPV